MTGKVSFSIIIPTRNERNNLDKLLPVLVRLYAESPIWIVDDNSADGTEKYIKQFTANHPQVHLITRQTKQGRGSAVLDGLKEAYKDNKISYFLEMDADLSHDPNEIEKLLQEAKKPQRHPRGGRSVIIVIGSRYIRGSKFVNCSPFRMFLSKLANWYTRIILSIPISDYTNGFRFYPRKAVEVLLKTKIHEKGYVTLSESAYILYKKGFKFKEVPTIFVNRKEGKSNVTIFEFLKSIPAILRIRFNH